MHFCRTPTTSLIHLCEKCMFGYNKENRMELLKPIFYLVSWIYFVLVLNKKKVDENAIQWLLIFIVYYVEPHTNIIFIL